LPFDFNNQNYQIININGQLLKKSKIKEAKINVASLNTGTCFLIIKEGKKTYSSRFVKM